MWCDSPNDSDQLESMGRRVRVLECKISQLQLKVAEMEMKLDAIKRRSFRVFLIFVVVFVVFYYTFCSLSKMDYAGVNELK